MDSILTSTKKLLGIQSDYTHFDADIMIHINTAFSVLTQLGVGPRQGFAITGTSETWDDFIPEDDPRMASVKTYIYIKVRLVFDPPTLTSVAEALKNTANEYEFRLMVAAEEIAQEEGNQNGI